MAEFLPETIRGLSGIAGLLLTFATAVLAGWSLGRAYYWRQRYGQLRQPVMDVYAHLCHYSQGQEFNRWTAAADVCQLEQALYGRILSADLLDNEEICHGR